MTIIIFLRTLIKECKIDMVLLLAINHTSFSKEVKETLQLTTFICLNYYKTVQSQNIYLKINIYKQ